uniref:Uncharacterized protein n=1 Tax=Brassica oleracea TaxID=3712 RepID=A0A3P6E1F3_BRAOL|nr:unnamed protein product [Brassica oleracea]
MGLCFFQQRSLLFKNKDQTRIFGPNSVEEKKVSTLFCLSQKKQVLLVCLFERNILKFLGLCGIHSHEP